MFPFIFDVLVECAACSINIGYRILIAIGVLLRHCRHSFGIYPMDIEWIIFGALNENIKIAIALTKKAL